MAIIYHSNYKYAVVILCIVYPIGHHFMHKINRMSVKICWSFDRLINTNRKYVNRNEKEEKKSDAFESWMEHPSNDWSHCGIFYLCESWCEETGMEDTQVFHYIHVTCHSLPYLCFSSIFRMYIIAAQMQIEP